MSNERVFKYSFVSYHLFLYYQSDRFPFTLQKLDTKGQPRSISFWTPLFHKFGSPYTYLDFIDSFVHPVMTIMIGNPPPRISLETKRVLQISKKTKVGDWYFVMKPTQEKDRKEEAKMEREEGKRCTKRQTFMHSLQEGWT